jgi:acyl-CoA synthetase (AMP-forming)/AMP-acid ligase II
VSAPSVVDPERAARYRREGYWRDETLGEFFRRAVDRAPDRPAVVDERGSLTYGELARRVDALAASLRDLGVRAGDVVSVQLPNRSEFVIAHLALERLGAVTNPLLPQYRSHDLDGMLARLDSVAAVFPAQHRGYDHLALWRDLRARHERLRDLVVVRDDAAGDPGDGVHRFDELAAAPGPAPPAARRGGDDVTIVIFTSGTVASKGVMHTHNTTLYGIACYARELRLDADSVVWMPSPIAHGTGLQWGVRTAMYLGAKLVLQDRWSPEEAASLVAREGCAVTMGATPFLHDLRALGPGRRADLRSLRYFACAGAPIPREVTVGVRAELGIDVLRAYGMSEHFVSTICRPDDPEEKRLTTDGRPFPGTEVAVFDPSRTRRLPDGQEGELAVRGPGVAVGYLRDPERTRDTWRADGWQFTDDLAVVDDEGFVRIVGRKKDLIIRGGLNIAPAEIEALLLEHPRVREVGVVGVPHERLGERICAVVVPAGDPPALDDLVAFLLARGVSKIKLPEALVVRDALPRTPSGKIRKDVLRDEVTQSGDRRPEP